MKINFHTSYLGETGYNNHARGLIKALQSTSKTFDIRVRSCTSGIGKDSLVVLEHNAYEDPDNKYGLHKDPDVDFVLVDTNHPYFFCDYNAKVTIACTVWESTTLPDEFVEELKQFDYLWVVLDIIYQYQHLNYQ